VKSHISEKSRHIIVRAEAGDTLPSAITRGLYECEVACGWLRASGVLADVELRAFSTEAGGLAPSRRIAGPVHALSIEGSVGLSRGEITVGMRAVIARETDRGMETIAGEIVTARVVALEAIVTALDDLALGRSLDASAGVWLLGDPRDPRDPREAAARPPEPPTPPPPQVARQAPKPEPAATWNEAIAASSDPEPARPQAARPAAASPGTNPMPLRPVRARDDSNDDALMPEAGDAVEHFAFGSAEVLKSDGERLHLRSLKDGRIREIALEMLRVTPLEAPGPQRRVKLERKL
jgi:predicted DNA-binding protein with PD1-like motif